MRANMIDNGFDLQSTGPREFLQKNSALALPHDRGNECGDFVFDPFKIQPAMQAQSVQSWRKAVPLDDPVSDEATDIA